MSGHTSPQTPGGLVHGAGQEDCVISVFQQVGTGRGGSAVVGVEEEQQRGGGLRSIWCYSSRGQEDCGVFRGWGTLYVPKDIWNRVS